MADQSVAFRIGRRRVIQGLARGIAAAAALGTIATSSAANASSPNSYSPGRRGMGGKGNEGGGGKGHGGGGAGGGGAAHCFLAGTHVVTNTGTVAIEDLRIGDLVATADRGVLPVRWIGRRTLKK